MASFWKADDGWPRDQPDWVFLARAVRKIGAAKYGDDWTGHEPWVWEATHHSQLEPFPMSPKFATTDEIRVADKHLREHRPELALNRPPLPSEYGRIRPYPIIPFTADEWEVGRTEANRWRNARRQLVDRVRDIIGVIATEAEAGRLVTGLRSEDGGAVRPMPAEWWSTEKLSPRFTRCKMRPSAPFGDGVDGYGYCWVFAGGESLERLIKTITVKPGSNSGARKKAAIEFLRPHLTKPRPPGMNKGVLQQQCMKATGVGVRGFLAAWDSIGADPSWITSGRPKSER